MCPNFHSHLLYSSICRGLHAESLHFSVFQFGSDFCCPDLYTQAQRSEREANYIVVSLTRVVKRNDTRIVNNISTTLVSSLVTSSFNPLCLGNRSQCQNNVCVHFVCTFSVTCHLFDHCADL